MTAFLQCFWIFPQIGFASIRNLMSSFGKAYDPLCTEISWAHLRYFSNKSKCGTWFPDFSDSRPKKIVLGPGDVFACFVCPTFYRFVYRMEHVPQTLSDTLYKCFLWTFPSIRHQPFFLNDFKRIEIFVKGVSGKSGFCLIELPIELPLWIQ